MTPPTLDYAPPRALHDDAYRRIPLSQLDEESPAVTGLDVLLRFLWFRSRHGQALHKLVLHSCFGATREVVDWDLRPLVEELEYTSADPQLEKLYANSAYEAVKSRFAGK